MSREITVDWPWPGEWESVEDVSAFYKDRLYPALSDYIGGIAESDTYIDHVVGPFTIGNLTKGSVLFAGTNGIVSQDNDDLFWDATNIRLGINVGTSPSVPLDVGGDCKFDGAVTINDAGADKDTRIEGLNKTHLVFVDASADFVGINDSAPVCRFQITGTACADYAGVGADTMLLIENNDNVAIHLQAATTGVAFIEFCDDNYNPPAGRVGYDFANAQMEFVVETNEHMWLTTTQLITDLGSLELSGAGAQLQFTGTAGGGNEGVLYKDSGSTNRYGLLFEATNVVALCNRASNGVLHLRANTATGGSGGEITVVTVDDTDITLSDGIGLNLQEDITFTGATTVNQIKFPDHLADALSFKEGANFYQTFITTNGSEVVKFGKNIIIPDAGYIGSVSDTDAFQIEADGDIVMTQDLAVTGALTMTGNIIMADGGTIGNSGALITFDDTNNYLEITGVDRIGLFTATPSYPLHLYVPGGSAATFGMQGTQANALIFGLYTNIPGVSNSGFTIRDDTAGANRLTIDSVGTINILQTLTVVNNTGIGQTAFGTNATKTLALGTGVAPTTSPANAFQVYSADIGGAAGKAGAHFRDEEGNIVSIGSGGILMSGTARVNKCFQFANAALGKGATKPDEVIVGNYWGWSYDIDDDSVLTVKLSDDWATGTDVLIYIRWAINEAYVTNSGEVRWQATWLAVPADATEAIDGAGTTDNSGDINIPATAYHLTQTLVETIPGASLAAGDELGVTIKRVAIGDGANPTADPVITCVGLVYTADKLGVAT